MTAPDAYEPLSPVEKLEDDASLAGLAAAEALRGVEIAAVVLLGLLVCPPLAILAFLVVAPLLGLGLAIGLIAAVVSVPFVIAHRLRARRRAHAR
jgi:hypothetical protein